MKALIVYYSMSGNVKLVAEKLAKETGADLLALHPVKAYPDKGARKFLWGGKSAVMGDKPKLQPYTFNAERYDTIIFGTPVWASSFTPPVRTFIEENRDKLSGKRFAAVLCFLGGGDQKAVKKLEKALGVESLAATVTLLEPKEKAPEELEQELRAFCERLEREQ